MSKHATIRQDSFAIRYGSLYLTTHSVSGRSYKKGYYEHPLGVVTVLAETGWCQIRTTAQGRVHLWDRHENLTDRQISNFCRKMLTDLHTT